jgi:hypothetical protein
VHKKILPALAVVALLCSTLSATPTTPKKKRHATNSTASTHKRHPGVATKTGAGTVNRSKTTTASARRNGKKSRGAARSYQQAPTPDRYKEIQQALASKGFFQGEANGEWGAESVDALKRFQASQNLTSDGKVTHFL